MILMLRGEAASPWHISGPSAYLNECMSLMVFKSGSLQQLFMVEDSFSSWLWIVGLLQNSSISDGCELINIQSKQSFIRVLLMHFKMMIWVLQISLAIVLCCHPASQALIATWANCIRIAWPLHESLDQPVTSSLWLFPASQASQVHLRPSGGMCICHWVSETWSPSCPYPTLGFSWTPASLCWRHGQGMFFYCCVFDFGLCMMLTYVHWQTNRLYGLTFLTPRDTQGCMQWSHHIWSMSALLRDVWMHKGSVPNDSLRISVKRL